MVLENFEIGSDGVSFYKNGQNLDLHNNYDLISFSYHIACRNIRLVWKLSDGNWVPDDLPETLTFSLLRVYLFNARERSQEVAFTEDGCLESIGFIWNDKIDEFEGYAKHQPSAECNHLNVNFQSGFAIKVGAEKAILIC